MPNSATTRNPLTATGWIATYQNITIDGIGATEIEARLDAEHSFRSAHLDPDDVEDVLADLTVTPATAALIADVEERGGAVSWRYVGGVACTCDEEEGI